MTVAEFDAKARFKSIEEIELHGTKIDFDNLWRFISHAVAQPRPERRPEGMSDERWQWVQAQPWGGDPDPESIRVAGFFLIELLEAAKHGKDLNTIVNQQLGVKKISEKIFDPAEATIHSPAFGIVMDYCRGELTRKGTIKEFRKNVAGVTDDYAGDLIDALKPRAETTVKALAMMEKDPLVTKCPPPREE